MKKSNVTLDERDLIRADGVCIGRAVWLNGPALEIKDADPRRTRERGSEYLYIDLSELLRLLTED